MAKRAGSDFDLFGDVKINTEAAISGLTKLSNLMDNIVKKLNAFEKSTIGTKISKALSVQDKIIYKAEKVQNRQNQKEELSEIRNNVRNKYQIQKEDLQNEKSIARNREAIRKSSKSSGYRGDYLAESDARYKSEMTAMRKYYSGLEAESNRNIKKQAAEEKRITKEKEKQLRLLERKKLAQQGILDKIFNIKNMLLVITASYMSRMVMQSVRIANRFQAVDVRFKALSDNASIAASEIDWIYERSTTLRQPILDAAEGYSKFYAAARSTVASDQIKEIYDALLQTSTVMHIQPHQFKLISLAVEQMASKGTISMEELRRQLGEHIPGAFGVAARAMGKTEQEFNVMVKRGEVFASEFLPKFAAQLKKEFGSGLQAALQSSQAKIIALQNSITMLQKKFADSGFIEAIGNVADSLRMALESKQFMEAFVAMGNAAKAFSKLMPMLLPLIELLVAMFGARYFGKLMTLFSSGSVISKLIKIISGGKLLLLLKMVGATTFLLQTVIFDILMRLLPKIINWVSGASTEIDWIIWYMKKGWTGLFLYMKDNIKELGNDFLDIMPMGSGNWFNRWGTGQKVSTNNANTTNNNNYNNDVKLYITAKDSKIIDELIQKDYSKNYATGGH